MGVTDKSQAAHYPAATWRLLIHGEADGAANMAMDEAILTAVVEGHSPPTLRLYAWSPPCLSLGRSQPLADVDLAACRDRGVDVVRRPTGGRAILHTDELTYAVAVQQSDPRATGDVVESYRRLSEGLLAGLRHLGADVAQATAQSRSNDPGQKTVPSAVTAACFETPSEYEITAGQRKLVGSAQWRARGGVLQHGTLPLRGDIARIADLLAFSDDEREAQRLALRSRATTLCEVLGRAVPFFEAAQALVAGFAYALDLALVRGELTDHERASAAELRSSRYCSAEWTDRG